MGKRKAQTKTAQNTDSPKKAKVEEEAKPAQKQVVKKNKKQKAAKAKKTEQSSNISIENDNKTPEIGTQKKNTKKAHKKNKKALKAKIEKTVSNQEAQNKTEKRVDLIPPELAKNLNKRQKQGITKKLKGLIKIREARGEILNQDEIHKLVQEIIGQKSVANDKAENGAGVVNKKQGRAQRKKKKQVKH